MTNFQLLTLISTITALMAGQTTIIILYINAKIDPLHDGVAIQGAKIDRLIEAVHDLDKRVASHLPSAAALPR
jgi:hypothetical protein